VLLLSRLRGTALRHLLDGYLARRVEFATRKGRETALAERPVHYLVRLLRFLLKIVLVIVFLWYFFFLYALGVFMTARF